MSKISIIKWVAVIVIIVILGFMGWYFSRTNSITSQTGGQAAKIKSSEKSITSFAFSGLDVGGNELIDSNSHTITVMVPKGTDVTNLTPIISVAGSATVSPIPELCKILLIRLYIRLQLKTGRCKIIQ